MEQFTRRQVKWTQRKYYLLLSWVVERIGVPQAGFVCMDGGGLPVFPSAANSAHQLNQSIHLQQQQHLSTNQIQQQVQQQQHHQANLVRQPLNNYSQQQQQQQQTLGGTNACSMDGVDRLHRRMETYRRRHRACEPRFDQTFSGVCEQQSIETTQLQKRVLENKAKKIAKKAEKKQVDTTLAGNLQSSVHVVSSPIQLFNCSSQSN